RRAAGTGRRRTLPELGSDLQGDAPPERRHGWPAAVAAAHRRLPARHVAARPGDHDAGVVGPGVQPCRHLPRKPEGTHAPARAGGLMRAKALEAPARARTLTGTHAGALQ